MSNENIIQYGYRLNNWVFWIMIILNSTLIVLIIYILITFLSNEKTDIPAPVAHLM